MNRVSKSFKAGQGYLNPIRNLKMSQGIQLLLSISCRVFPKGLGGNPAFAGTLPARWTQSMDLLFLSCNPLVSSIPFTVRQGFADAASLERLLFILPETILPQPFSEHEML